MILTWRPRMILIYIQMSLNIDMETAIKTIQARLQEEWQDLDVQYPGWLATILDSELYYTVAMIVVCANAFGIGLVIGWISGHTGR